MILNGFTWKHSLLHYLCDSVKLLFQQNEQSTARSAQPVCVFWCLLRFVPARLIQLRSEKRKNGRKSNMAPASTNEEKMNCTRSACPSGWHLLDRPPSAGFMASLRMRNVGFVSRWERKQVFSCFSLSRSLFLGSWCIVVKPKSRVSQECECVLGHLLCVWLCVTHTSHVKWLFCGWASCLMYQDQSVSALLVTDSFVIFHIR